MSLVRGLLDGILGGGDKNNGKNTPTGPVANPGTAPGAGTDPKGGGGGILGGGGGILGGGDGGGGILGGGGGGGGILPSVPLSIPGLSLPGVSLPIPTGSASDANSASLSTPSASGPSLSLPSGPSSSLPSQQSDSPTPSASAPPSASVTPPPDVITDANGNVQTISHTVFVSDPGASASDAANVGGARHVSFLENKPLSGAVFGLCGLVGLVLLISLVTFTVRRTRRKRLLDEAVSFDPGLLAAAERYDAESSSEKGHGHASHPSLGSTGTGPGGGAGGGGGYGNSMYGNTAAPGEYYDYGTRMPGQTEYYAAPGGVGQTEYYDYGATNAGRQLYYSTYVPPMAGDAPPPPSSLAYSGQSQASQQSGAPRTTTRAPQSIPRVAPPTLPEVNSVSDGNNRRQSMEEAEFWARTLKVTNE